MTAKILLVDDEERVLEAYQRALRKEFQFDTATGGQEALALIDSGEVYHVIVSDMRMPAMNGVEFLAAAKRRCPDTIRMMLTGNSDQRTAIDAINTGDIFRFLNKPCPPDALASAIRDALRQYQLITAERELLEDTLRGSIEVFTELLSLLSPKSLGFTMQVKRYARDVAKQLEIDNVWWVETLAMLSQIGCVTLPEAIQDKVAAGAPLLGNESELFADHPAVGASLIAKIPRLETMADAIRHQADAYDGKAAAGDAERGAGILKVVVDFVRSKTTGHDNHGALARLKRRHDQYDPGILSALERVIDNEAACETASLKLSAIDNGMLLDEDIYSKTSGILLVCKGQEVTPSIRQHLVNFMNSGQVDNEFKVVLRQAAKPAAEADDSQRRRSKTDSLAAAGSA